MMMTSICYLRGCHQDEILLNTRSFQMLRKLLGRTLTMALLVESNVEAVTGEASTIIHDVGRSIGSEIISTEVLAACSVVIAAMNSMLLFMLLLLLVCPVWLELTLVQSFSLLLLELLRMST